MNTQKGIYLSFSILLVTALFLFSFQSSSENLITGAAIGTPLEELARNDMITKGVIQGDIQIMAAPSVDSLILNSTDPTSNDTNQNITAYVTVSDGDSDPVKTIYNWFVNDTSLTVLNMPFEADGNNNVSDYSGYGNNGTVSGAVWNATGGYDGNASFVFDGSSAYVDLGNPSNLPSGASARTMCLWAKPETVSGGYHWAVAYGTPTTSDAFFIG